MITIKEPYIKDVNDRARCYCDVDVDDETRTIWFEVGAEYKKYLVTERADAYVIGLLNFAMRENHNIRCEIPMTDELLYNINTILIPTLANYSKNLNHIIVNAPIEKPLECGSYIGTGLSCGVDSFDSIKNHFQTCFPSLDITHLCINNVGAFNECYEHYGINKTRVYRYNEARMVAAELGLPLVETDSNFYEVFPQVHYLTNTYSSCFAIYMLKKMWKIYYLASVGLDYSRFSIVNNDLEDSAHYDLLSLTCFSNFGLKIFSEGGEKMRYQKTMNIADFNIAQEHLHVCINKPTNCGVCSKCRRTLVTLDLINKLDDFKKVFDIDYYRNNKEDYYKWLANQHSIGDEMNEVVYQGMLTRKEFKKIAKLELIKHQLRKVKRKFIKL